MANSEENQGEALLDANQIRALRAVRNAVRVLNAIGGAFGVYAQDDLYRIRERLTDCLVHCNHPQVVWQPALDVIAECGNDR